MAMLATLTGSHNLFSNLPTTTALPPSSNGRLYRNSPPKPPIPVPKYPPPPPSKSRKFGKNQTRKTPSKSKEENPGLKTHHNNSKYYKPVKDGQVIPAEGDRSIVVGDNGLSYKLPGAPFEFQFSYSEVPKAKPLAMREPAFLPFAPPTMPRPWTGKAPMKKSKRKIKLFEPLVTPENRRKEEEEMKHFEMLKAYELGKYTIRSRKEVLGKPLTRQEIRELLQPCISSNRQVNLGRFLFLPLLFSSVFVFSLQFSDTCIKTCIDFLHSFSDGFYLVIFS